MITAELAKNGRADDAELIEQQLDYLDEMVEKHGIAYARSIAEVNKNSIGNWGQVWLDTRAAVVGKAAAESTLTTIMKSAEVSVTKAMTTIEKAVEAYTKSNPGKGINEFLDTDEGAVLKEKYDEARERLFAGPVEAFTKSANDRIAYLTSETNKAAEEFAIHHNLDLNIAKTRLAEISPTFAAKMDELADARASFASAVDKAKVYAEQWQNAQESRIEKAHAAEIEKLQKEEDRKYMVPAERKIFELADAVVAKEGCDINKAVCEVMETAEGRVLAELAQEERARL